MNLDSRTMMVMMSALNLLFAGLLILAGLHAGNTRGVRHWAIGSLCIGLGLGFSYTQLELAGSDWVLVLGATLVAAGIGLQFNGIQTFKEGRCNSYIPWLLACVVLAQGLWFVILHHDVHGRVIANSLVLALGNAACARALPDVLSSWCSEILPGSRTEAKIFCCSADRVGRSASFPVGWTRVMTRRSKPGGSIRATASKIGAR